MYSQMNKYLGILAIELDDLESDLALLMEAYEEKNREHRITNYVLLENLAVLRNEMCGVERFKSILQQLNPGEYPDLESFVTEIKKRFKTLIHTCGLVEAVYPIIERKLNKVLKYVTHE